jgi:hypothetical protein
MNFSWEQCLSAVDLLLVGDSQSGASWSKSYFGNFFAACLKGNFVVYARGGTVPGNWLGSGGMDPIETIQRDPQDFHFNVGPKENVPLCKKESHLCLKLINLRKFFFSLVAT